MSNYKRKEVMNYLTRKPLSEQDLQMAYEAGQQTLDSIPETQVTSGEERVLNRQPFYQNPPQLFEDDSASPQVDGIPLYQGVKPGVAIEERMPIYLPPDMAPVMPQAPGIPDPQYRQLELATGGRVKFGEGSKLTGTDKTLEQNIKDDHKAYNDYRKSIGQSIVPLDNAFIKMWQRTRLNSGGPVKNQTPKFIPMDLESVAFRLFQDNLDNLSYNQKQTVYNYIEDNRNKKATGGRIGYETGGGVSEEQNLIEEILSGKIKIGANFTNKNKDDPFNKYGFGKKDIKDPRLGIEYNMDPGNERSSKIGISVGPKGGSISFMKPFSEKLNEEKNEDVIQTYIDFAKNVWGVEVTEQEARKALGIYDIPNTSIRNELPPEEIEGKANGGRIKLQNGSDDGYMQEIPSLGFSDPIDILEQQLINEKDPTIALALDYKLENAKKERKAKETEAAEYKKSQKEKGVKYKEDFPSEAAYFAETGKQLLTNPKYFLSKGAKGVVEGTEFLVGQPLQTLFNQEGKNFEFYQPVLGEKLGINKFIEKNIPKDPTTGTLFAGDVAEIAGSIADPFLAYGLAKGAIKGTKAKPPTTAVDETIDPTRRDILKTGVVMGTGALLYPTAKKLDLLKLGTSVKPSVFAEAVKGTTAPSWMDSLITKIFKEGTNTKMSKYETESGYIKKEIEFKNPKTNDTQKATLTIDPIQDRISIEYYSPTNVAEQPVLLELKREIKFVDNPDGKSFTTKPDKTKGYRFETTEAGPRVVDWDGNIEFDAEDNYKKIIELKSDISGLKSYATEGKGIDKKIAKEKRAATADVEKNPEEYVPDNAPDYKYWPND